MTIEPLEPRIAPAGVFRTFTDVDGDLVTLKISKGTEDDVFIQLSTASGPYGGQQIQILKLQENGDFRGANLSLTAKPQDANGDGVLDGDGRVNLGSFDAGLPIGMLGGRDLGVLTFGGDVGKVRIGDWQGSANGNSFASLTLGSLGVFGTSTGAPDLVSDIYGKAGALKIVGDLAVGATLRTTTREGSTANLASVTIGGSVAGTLIASATRAFIAGDLTGRIEGDFLGGYGNSYYGLLEIKGSLLGGAAEESGLVKNVGADVLRIGGDIRGGAGERSGGIFNGAFTKTLKVVAIGGSVSGGTGDHSGIIVGSSQFAVPEIGSLTIGGDLRGGAGDGSGRIGEKPELAPSFDFEVRSVTIGGSVIGGSGQLSGVLEARSIDDPDLPPSGRAVIKIGRDLVAGSAVDSGRLTLLGVRSVEIGGSIIGGTELRSGNLTLSGGAEMDRFKIGGDVRGGSGGGGVIQAGGSDVREFFLGGSLLDGPASAGGTITLARVTKLTVGGDVRGLVSVTSIGAGTIGGSLVSDGGAGTAALQVKQGIGSLTVGGSVLGASIRANGEPDLIPGDAVIGLLKIGGSVERSTIYAGLNTNADAQIGAVTVGGDWIASSLGAGGGPSGTDADGRISRIASVTIKGMAFGTLDSNDTATFSIAAQEIGAISIAGKAEPLQKGPGNDTFNSRHPLGATFRDDGTGDFFAFELPRDGATTAPVTLPAAPRPAAGADFTFTDVDGDLVSVVISKGSPPANLVARGPFAAGRQLLALNVASDSEGANITITAQRQDANGDGFLDGDGLVNVGQINANGVALGAITIRGDLGAIDAAAVKSVSALSLGRFGTTTGAFDTTSTIAGAVGTVTLGSDLTGTLRAASFTSVSLGGALAGSLFATDGAIGKLTVGRDLRGAVEAPTIGAITVGGSVFGDEAGGGKLRATSKFTGAVKIGKNFGGFLANAGRIYSGGDLPGITIGGSMLGLDASAATIEVLGKLGPVTVAGSLDGAAVAAATITSNGALTKVAIGGSVLATAANAANVTAQSIGIVTIGRDVLARAAGGSITATGGGIGSLTIVGSLQAGFGAGNAAAIVAQGDLGTVKIGRDVVGSGTQSGYLSASGAIKSFTIGGSVLGAAAMRTGSISAGGAITTAKIGRDLVGGTYLDGAALFERSAYVEGLRLGSLTIGGSLRAGANLSATLGTDFNGSIRVVNDIGSLTVLGNIVGSASVGTAASQTIPVVISAHGQAVATGRTDLAIGKITIGGRVEETIIRAGFPPNVGARNADAQIGSVIVSGDWRASTMVAGVEPNLGGYGNADDAKIDDAGVKDLPDSTGAISRIASLTIKGAALGSLSAPDARNFAIAAQQIGALQIGVVKFPLKAGPSSDTFAAGAARRLGPTTGSATPDGSDFHMYEV